MTFTGIKVAAGQDITYPLFVFFQTAEQINIAPPVRMQPYWELFFVYHLCAVNKIARTLCFHGMNNIGTYTFDQVRKYRAVQQL